MDLSENYLLLPLLPPLLHETRDASLVGLSVVLVGIGEGEGEVKVKVKGKVKGKGKGKGEGVHRRPSGIRGGAASEVEVLDGAFTSPRVVGLVAATWRADLAAVVESDDMDACWWMLHDKSAEYAVGGRVEAQARV